MTITLAGNASTNSRGNRPLPPGAVSARTISGNGPHELTEFAYADGRRERRVLLSWVGGQAGLLWGHGPLPYEIEHAARQQMPGSYGHAAEWALCDILGEVYSPYITSDRLAVRFACNGSDVTSMAVRLARAATGRDTIVGFGYHGHGDSFAFRPMTKGVPDALVALHHYEPQMGNVNGSVLRKAAAIVIEVPAWDDEAAIAECLQVYRQICDDTGALLVIDDVVAGFRLALGGTCERYGVKADLIACGKAMSATGGVSALIGREDLVGRLGGEVFYSGTFFGAPGPVSIANATVRYLLSNAVEVYEYLGLIGSELKAGYNALGIRTVGQNERSAFAFDTDAAWLGFCQQMIIRDIMVHRPNFPTVHHQLSDVRKTLEIAAEVLDKASVGVV